MKVANACAPPHAPRVKHVLVLDDDVHIAELVRVVLEDAGYAVRVGTRIDDVPDGSFDCVLTDLMSVAVYRYDDARDWILRLADRFPNVPVIVMTAHPEASKHGAALGARHVIIKPFDVDQIAAAVREATGP